MHYREAYRDIYFKFEFKMAKYKPVSRFRFLPPVDALATLKSNKMKSNKSLLNRQAGTTYLFPTSLFCVFCFFVFGFFSKVQDQFLL